MPCNFFAENPAISFLVIQSKRLPIAYFPELAYYYAVCCMQSYLTLWDPMDCSPQEIFPTRKLNLHPLHLLHWQADSLPLAPSGKPRCQAACSYGSPSPPLQLHWPSRSLWAQQGGLTSRLLLLPFPHLECFFPNSLMASCLHLLLTWAQTSPFHWDPPWPPLFIWIFQEIDTKNKSDVEGFY